MVQSELHSEDEGRQVDGDSGEPHADAAAAGVPEAVADTVADPAVDCVPAGAGSDPVAADRGPVAADGDPFVAGRKPYVADRDSLAADSNPLVADRDPVAADGNPFVADRDPLVADGDRFDADGDPIAAGSDAVVPADEPLTPYGDPVAPDSHQVGADGREPVAHDSSAALQLHFDTIAHDFNPPRHPSPETERLASAGATGLLAAGDQAEPLAFSGDATEALVLPGVTAEPAAPADAVDRRRVSASVRLTQIKEELVAWVKTLLSAAVYAILIVTFGFQVARVEGQSMAPTLEDQDRLIVNKAVYRISEPRRGDIVMLYYPLNPDKSFVKRVIAEEGDQVRIVDGRVYVNDVPVHDDYVPPQYRSHDEWGPQVIPEGYYFVMGDHRNNSSDSRTWGFVPKKYIIGKVQLRWWPVPTARVF